MVTLHRILPAAAWLAFTCAPMSAMATQAVSPPVDCTASFATVSNAGYVSCQGSVVGNIGPGQTAQALFGGVTYNLVGKSDDAGFGPFSVNPGAGTSGGLTFDGLVKGLFVLGIKGGPDYSLYLFNGGTAGIHTLAFDTLGIATGNGAPGPGPSHLALFGPMPVSAVPEPEAYVLMLAGLGFMGALSRRRKNRQA